MENTYRDHINKVSIKKHCENKNGNKQFRQKQRKKQWLKVCEVMGRQQDDAILDNTEQE